MVRSEYWQENKLLFIFQQKGQTVINGDDSLGNAIWKEVDTNPRKFEIHVIYNEKCKFVGEHEDTHLLSLC